MATTLEFLPSEDVQAEITDHHLVSPSVRGEPHETYEQDTESQLQAIRAQKEAYNSWFMQFIESNLQALDPNNEVQCEVEKVSVDSLLSSIQSTAYAYSFAYALKQCAEAVKELDLLMLQFEEVSHKEDPSEYSRLMHLAIERLGFALYSQQVASQSNEGQKALPSLSATSSALERRLASTQSTLVNMLHRNLEELLETCGWPPPLTMGTGSSIGQRGGNGFKGSWEEPTLSLLVNAMSLLTSCQHAVMASQFAVLAASPPGPEHLSSLPLLWVVEAMVKPVEAALLQEFGPGGEAYRIDKPEWLLTTIVSTTAAYGPLFAPLDASLAASNLNQLYSLELEWGRAMRAAAFRIMRDARLPGMLYPVDSRSSSEAHDLTRATVSNSGAGDVTAGAMAAVNGSNGTEGYTKQQSILSREAAGKLVPSTLWLHTVDAILKFEGAMAPLLGLVGIGSEGASGAPSPPPLSLLSSSVLGALTGHEGFLGAWLTAEEEVLRAEMDEAMYEPGAMKTTAEVLKLEEETPAWRSEYRSPQLAEKAMAMVEAALTRIAFIPGWRPRGVYMGAVGRAVLDALLGRLERLIDQVEAFDNFLDENWLPKVCACICACRYVSQRLEDATLQPICSATDEPATTSQISAGTRPTATENGITGPTAVSTAARAASTTTDQPATTAAEVLRCHARRFSNQQRSWCMSLSQALVTRFGTAVLPYRKALAQEVSRRTKGQDEEDEGLEMEFERTQVDAQSATSTSANGLTPSSALLPALDLFSTTLSRLSNHLDAVAFRDVWRGSAVAINRLIFNWIAAELRFTPLGGRQLHADVAALMSLLAPYTARPAAHFRELNAAAALLSAEDETAAAVIRAISMPGATPESDPFIVSLGAGCLTTPQIVNLIEHRL